MNRQEAIQAMLEGKVVRHASTYWNCYRLRETKTTMSFEVSTNAGESRNVWSNCLTIVGEREGWEVVNESMD